MSSQWLVPGLGLALLLGGVAGALIARWSARTLARRRLLRRFARGRLAEVEAVALLEQHGYEVLGEQVEGGYELRVDGEPAPVRLRADLIAARGGSCYLVEVKTGASASPRVADTRRQLLEYRHAFGAEIDGTLLADMEQGRLLALDFGEPGGAAPAPRRTGPLVWLALGAVVGAGAGLLLSRLW